MTAADRPAIVAGTGDAPVVPEGWTIALSLSERAVDELVRAAWDIAHADGTAALCWESAGSDDDPPVRVRLTATVSCPAVRLDAAAGTVEVAFAVDQGLLYMGVAEAEAQAADTRVVWSEPIAIDAGDALRLAGAVVPRVDPADPDGVAIRLDLSGGGFVLTGDVLAGLSSCRPAGAGITRHGEDPVDVSALTLLSFALHPEASVLQVAAVAAKPVALPDGSAVLQVLAGPTSSAVTAVSGAVPGYAAGQDFGLAIGSQATMTLIANRYNQGGGDIKLVPVPPPDGQGPWCAQVHQPMVFDGRFGNQDGVTYVHDHATMVMRFGGSAGSGLTLSTEIDPSSTIRLHLDLSADFPVTIAQDGEAQLICLEAGKQAVAGAGFYESIVRPQLAAFLHGDIRTDMAQVRIIEVDALVRQVLRLPRHTLRFDDVALPGELLIVGALLPA